MKMLNLMNQIQKVKSKKLPNIQTLNSAYNCEICNFVSKMESELRIHMSKKHVVIEQLDGYLLVFKKHNDKG